MTQIEMAENNDRAVVLSEEAEFLDALLANTNLPPESVRTIIDRRDAVRDAMRPTGVGAGPTDEAMEGIPLPDSALPDEPSEAYDADDAVEVLAEDEDHIYKTNRAMDGSDKQRCLVCGEPESEHE